MSSDWKESAIRRRDIRHTAVPDAPVRTHAKKDTRRWCKGKEGREHTAKCFALGTRGGRPRFELICTTCGRRLNYWSSSPWVNAGPKGRAKPDWVDT